MKFFIGSLFALSFLVLFMGASSYSSYRGHDLAVVQLATAFSLFLSGMFFYLLGNINENLQRIAEKLVPTEAKDTENLNLRSKIAGQ